MPILYVMAGTPGSGKTTYVKGVLEEDSQIHVSRDEIRFSLVPEGQPYFSKETLVYNTFIEKICQGLAEGYDVYADATHLTVASRRKLLNRIPTKLYDEVHCLWFDVHVSTCVAQNNLRKGTRAYVPENDLKQMYYKREKPFEIEGFDMIEVIRPKNAFIKE